jgi:transcriptional regulator with AAA-type ATPase domain
MGTPVFKHTAERISAVLEDDRSSLSSVLALMKYDPGLFFSFLRRCCSMHGYEDVSTLSQAGALLGSNAIRDSIAGQTQLLDDPDSMMLWHAAALSGIAALRINQRAPTANDEEVFFAAVMPFVGMLLITPEKPEYKRLIPLLVKLSVEDRVFLENAIFGVDHISILDRELNIPIIYRDMLRFIRQERFPSSLRLYQSEVVSRYSVSYAAAQLYRLSMSAEYIAQSILFPFVVLAEENFKRINKRFFQIPEHEAEEMLTDIVESYEDVCRTFGQEETAAQLIGSAAQYKAPECKFLTASPPLLRTLNKLFEERRLEDNLVIIGEPGSGKRLLAKSLHYHSANPRRLKPLLSFHCDTLERETLEEELLGAKSGFFGKQTRQKGAFEIVDSGTIMLKDINMMPLPLQERLSEIVSLIDYYRSKKITGKQPDVLFIVTSRLDLEAEAAAGRFSKALLRSLKAMTVTIPPLRERREDIGLIADGIIKKYQLPLRTTPALMQLQEIYENNSFDENLSGLKRILFDAAAKELLKPEVLK